MIDGLDISWEIVLRWISLDLIDDNLKFMGLQQAITEATQICIVIWRH